MKIIDFFDISKFGAALAGGVLAAAIIIIIQFSWMSNTKLVKVELQNIEIFEELSEIKSDLKALNSKVDDLGSKVDNLDSKVEINTEEIKKANSAINQLVETAGTNSKMLEEVQSQLIDLPELEQRVEENKQKLDESSEKSEFLRGQLETILSSKQE